VNENTYKDKSGRTRRLTRIQEIYLKELDRKGHLQLRGHLGFNSTITFNLLVERGLAIGAYYHCASNQKCLTYITDLGREVLDKL
jgi:hypothetical protein